eukprot:1619560-Pleurochrysis_carterae.AAC.1
MLAAGGSGTGDAAPHLRDGALGVASEGSSAEGGASSAVGAGAFGSEGGWCGRSWRPPSLQRSEKEREARVVSRRRGRRRKYG